MPAGVVNSFVPNAPFLYAIKTPESRKYYIVYYIVFKLNCLFFHVEDNLWCFQNLKNIRSRKTKKLIKKK